MSAADLVNNGKSLRRLGTKEKKRPSVTEVIWPILEAEQGYEILVPWPDNGRPSLDNLPPHPSEKAHKALTDLELLEELA